MREIQFITLNPGHFHAALVQKEMYEHVSPTVHVYAPLGPDLLAHLGRISAFNNRSEHPTKWKVEVHADADYLNRFAREKPGSVVVLAGRNSRKIEGILAALEAGLNVLADKPWIIVPEDLGRLQLALDLAETRGLIAYDIMTERYEVTSILQREFIQDEPTFGTITTGSPDEPAVYMESVHYLKKTVAGAPLRRPAWFFDVHEQGEALSDVGTHLVDLVNWMLYPNQEVRLERDICLMSARRWPTVVSKAGFQQITGESDFPASLSDIVAHGELPYFCNSSVHYAVSGVNVKLDVVWDYEAAAGGGDTHLAVFRGTRSRVEIRQGREEKYQPELYIVPVRTMDHPLVRRAIDRKIQSLAPVFPGLEVIDLGTHFRLGIPSRFRVGHEAHFAEVTKQFLRYVRGQDTMPAWEKPNMLAKYGVTTRGVDMSRKSNRI